MGALAFRPIGDLLERLAHRGPWQHHIRLVLHDRRERLAAPRVHAHDEMADEEPVLESDHAPHGLPRRLADEVLSDRLTERVRRRIGVVLVTEPRCAHHHLRQEPPMLAPLAREELNLNHPRLIQFVPSLAWILAPAAASWT